MTILALTKIFLPKQSLILLFLLHSSFFHLVVFEGTICEENNQNPKRYTIDLGVDPRNRWNHVIEDNIELIPEFVSEIRNIVPSLFRRPVFRITESIVQYLPEEYAEELKGIANSLKQITNITMGEIVAINLLYDLTDFRRYNKPGSWASASASRLGCTSIVAIDERGTILHGRNLDYGFEKLLRKATIVVDFVRNGRINYSSVTFVLWIGAITAQKPNKFTVSLNARYSGSPIDNLLMEIFTHFQHPVGFEIRSVLDSASSYGEALSRLRSVHFVAPSYIILGGVNNASIITRNRWSAADIISVNPNKGRWFLIETNYDNWKHESDKRRFKSFLL